MPDQKALISQTGERIREIRESQDMGRQQFADITGIAKKTIENTEAGRQRATEQALAAIAKQWPQYALWLLTGEERPELGQISPATEKIRTDLDRAGNATH